MSIKKKRISIPVNRKFLDKGRCIVEARMLVNSKRIDMDIQQCAEEIYAHSVAYYIIKKLNKIKIDWKWLKNHANPIDLEDGGDKKHRIVIYKLIWIIVPSR